MGSCWPDAGESLHSLSPRVLPAMCTMGALDGLKCSGWRGRFAERHRRLLNMLLHQTPALLEGPLACMMRVPRLIDFDNKRAYFRARIRGERERYSGSLRIHVRREHVFEDSFHQLRAK